MNNNKVILQIGFITTTILYLFLQTNLFFASFMIDFEEYLLVLKNIFLTLNVMLLGYFSISFKWTKKQAHWIWVFIISLMIMMALLMVVINFIGVYGHWTGLPEQYLAIMDFLSYLTYERGSIYVTLLFMVCYLIRLVLFKGNIIRKTKTITITLIILLVVVLVIVIALSITVLIYDCQYISKIGIYQRSNFFYSLEEPTVIAGIFFLCAFMIGLCFHYFQGSFYLKKLAHNYLLMWQLMVVFLVIIIYFTSQLIFYSHSTIGINYLLISFLLLTVLSTLETNLQNKIGLKSNNIFNTTIIMMPSGIALTYILDFSRDFRSTFFISLISAVYSHWFLLLLWTLGYLIIIYFICFIIKKISFYLFIKLSNRLKLYPIIIGANVNQKEKERKI